MDGRALLLSFASEGDLESVSFDNQESATERLPAGGGTSYLEEELVELWEEA